MVVGLLKVTMIIPENASLKGKRRVVKSLVGRLQSRFHVSAAEVGDQDLWQRAEVGLAVVSNDRRFINSILDKIEDFVEREAEAEIIDVEMDIQTIFSGGGF